MKKRTAVLIGSLMLLAALVAAGTWAYFTGDVHVTNVITTGTISINLNSTAATELTGVMPGRTVEQVVSVTNDDEETSGDAWIRVKVETTITGENNEPLENTFGDQSAVTINYAEKGWLYDGGYYYYTKPLARNAQTTPLFESVGLNSQLPNDYQGCTVQINVQAQAVQVKNNDNNGNDLTADTLTNVKGWPADTDSIEETITITEGEGIER